MACATFSRFSYLPCAYGAARELCRETLATQGFLRICRTCRQIRLKPKRAAIFYSSEVSRQAALGPGKVSLPGPSLFRRGSSGAWDRGGYALSLRPCCPQALLSSVGVGTGYALPPPPRLGAAWPQIQNIQPLPHAPRKKARSLSPARLALRGRRDSRNSGCWRPTAVARGGRGLLSPWGSCFATARGRYHLFPGGRRGVVGLGETLSGRGAATGHTLRTKPRPMACGPGRLHPPAAGCRPRPPASAVARRSLPA